MPTPHSVWHSCPDLGEARRAAYTSLGGPIEDAAEIDAKRQPVEADLGHARHLFQIQYGVAGSHSVGEGAHLLCHHASSLGRIDGETVLCMAFISMLRVATELAHFRACSPMHPLVAILKVDPTRWSSRDIEKGLAS